MGAQTDSAAGRLSRREREVAALVAEGLTNREIARRLFISERTVDGHLEHVREKLGVNSRAQVAAWVTRQETDGQAPNGSQASSRPLRRRRLVAHPRLWMAAALVVALLAAGVGVLRLTAPPEPIIETIAGAGSPNQGAHAGVYTGERGPAIDAQLSEPSDVAADRLGNIYIADYGSRAVRRVAGNGIITTVAGGGLAAPHNGAVATTVSLGYPSNLAVDNVGRLFVLTNLGGMLQIWMVQDTFLTLVAPLGHSDSGSPLAFWNPPVGGLVIASDGTQYIADRAGNRVWLLTRGGTPVPFAGTGEPGYTGDLGAASAAELHAPIGLALDSVGNLYVADSDNNAIRKVDHRTGIITTVAGGLYGDSGDGAPAKGAGLKFPYGVAVGRDGSIFVADTGNNKLRKVTAGVIFTVAGTGRSGLTGDHGSAINAELNGPEGISIDVVYGGLLIADTQNQRVREISGVAT